MSLRIRRLQLVSMTLKGDYAADLVFPDGLVLLHVRNTSGKSTALKSIIYGLGLEKMFGPANQPPLTPAMTSAIKDGDDEIPVVESYVVLQIENGKGEVLTIRRKVVGEGGKSWKLVEVWSGSITNLNKVEVEPQSFYVRDEKSATREQGFYPFLANFVGWDLPEVVRHDGGSCPLYMECLLPLFYVEQSHGWTAIQATTPKFMQIRQVERKAIEFILALTSGDRDTERQRLEKQEEQIKRIWLDRRTQLEAVARSVGGGLRNAPSEPVATWPFAPVPFAEVFQEGQSVPLAAAIVDDRETLAQLEEQELPSVEDAAEEAQVSLRQTNDRLVEAEALAVDIYEDLQLERVNLEALKVRIKVMKEDLEHNLGSKKLQDLGATSNLSISKGQCPTCHQPVADSLLDQNEYQRVMTLDENIEYLRAQIQTFENMRERTSGAMDAMERRYEAVDTLRNELRSQIRSLKRTLTSSPQGPSEAAVRERLTVEDRLERRLHAQQRFNEGVSEFEVLVVQWRELLTKRKGLQDQTLSREDERKRAVLETRFIELLKLLGFRSFTPSRFSIDRESFRPTREGFDVVYDVSASDNVRTIAAYLTALLELARTFPTNHPGLLILDEPRQQNLHWGDLEALLERLAMSLDSGQQVIVATSDPSERIDHFAGRVKCTRIDLEGPILRLVQAEG